MLPVDIPKEILVAVIGAVSALLAPLLSSFLQRSGNAQKAKELEVVEKQVQIIERLLTLEKYLSDERRKLLQTELADLAREVVAERVRERSPSATVVDRLPMWRRWFLAYEQPTMRASVYRGFFWFFLVIGVLGGTLGTMGSLQTGGADWPFAVIGGLFYLAIGLAFYFAALRQQKQAEAGSGQLLAEDRLPPEY